MAKVGRALVSVADKRGLAELVAGLEALGIEVVSTGGTAALLRQKGIPVTDVASATGFPEVLGGRFKTLHPLVHCAILAARDRRDHMADLERHGVRPIDLVVVNLAPFELAAAGAGCTVEQAIEAIDIGGPALIRSAAKNHAWVTVVVDPDDYDHVLGALRQGGGVPLAMRAELALKAFRLAARYDRAIAAYLASSIEGRFPVDLALDFVKAHELRGGENAHQAAALYREPSCAEPSAATATQLTGVEALSYGSLLDLDAALRLLKDLDEPAAAIVRHASPCGAAVGSTCAEAFGKASAASPAEALGVLVALSRRVDVATAERLAAASGGEAPMGFEVIAAPDYDEGALQRLAAAPAGGAGVRVVRTGAWSRESIDTKAYDGRRIVGGLLVQDRDLAVLDRGVKVATARQPTEAEWRELRFAWVCAKHAASHAVALAADGVMVGVGAGQPRCIDAARLAALHAGERAQGAALASDSPVASPDVVETAAQAGCTAIIQPGGAESDAQAVDKANELGIAMVFTGLCHLRH